eukprot:3108485-Amphidinium_carterae.1
MTSEMTYLRDLRTKLLAEAEKAAKMKGPSNATPAGGTGASASSSAAGGTKRSQPKGAPPSYHAKPPPPQPGRDESAGPGTGPQPKYAPASPKQGPPGSSKAPPPPAPPPQRVIEHETMPQDKS